MSSRNSSYTDKVYMDYNATTPLDPEVLDAITHALEHNWANPSCSYSIGKEAKDTVESARFKVAQMIGAKADEIIFTSGGTEANNMVIKSVVEEFQNWLKDDESLSKFKPHVITSDLEHDSIILPLMHLKSTGKIDYDVLPIKQAEGIVDVTCIEALLRPSTCLLSIMLANNETGIIQPISDLRRKLKRAIKPGRKHPIYIHTDAAQAIGKVPVNVQDLDVDFLTVVGHKFYGPRIGALYTKDCCRTCLKPMLFGGGQERGYRSGTENTGMIAGLGKAAELVTNNLGIYQNHMKKVRGSLESELVKKFGDDVRLLSVRPGAQRIPNTSSVAFIGSQCTGKLMLSMCRKLISSVGAACHEDITCDVSKVLLASGVPADVARNAIRLSIGRSTSFEDIQIVVEDLFEAFSKIQAGIIQSQF